MILMIRITPHSVRFRKPGLKGCRQLCLPRYRVRFSKKEPAFHISPLGWMILGCLIFIGIFQKRQVPQGPEIICSYKLPGEMDEQDSSFFTNRFSLRMNLENMQTQILRPNLSPFARQRYQERIHHTENILKYLDREENIILNPQGEYVYVFEHGKSISIRDARDLVNNQLSINVLSGLLLSDLELKHGMPEELRTEAQQALVEYTRSTGFQESENPNRRVSPEAVYLERLYEKVSGLDAVFFTPKPIPGSVFEPIPTFLQE